MNKILGILLLLVFVCVGTTLLTDAFVKPFNMQNIVRHSALYGIIGVGVAMVIITGGIDLSIGSVIGLVGCLLPMLLVDREWSVPMALAAVMVLSLIIGLTHGLLITKMRLQPFIVTLCGLLVYRGLARWITSDQTKGFGSTFNDSLRLLAIGKPCSVAFLALLTGIGVVLWCGWRLIRRRSEVAVSDEAKTVWWQLPAVGVVLGLLLIVTGGSRFAMGYQIESAGTLVSLGPIDFPAWTTRVHPDAVGIPRLWMTRVGWLVPIGGIWLSIVLVLRNPRSIFLPVVLAVAAVFLVMGATILVDQPDEWFIIGKGADEESQWFGVQWARTWRIMAVFSSLGLFMASLAWLGQRAVRIAGAAASAPLLLTSGCAILWLLGKTPLGETLVPAPLILLMVLAFSASIFLNQTIYGRYLLALGNNEEAARFSGINTDRMVILAYVLCSLAAGLGGILFALDTNSIQPASHGNFYELYAIAAAVLGGCSLRGGEGTILGVVIGAAVMRVLYNSINLIGIPSQLEFAIIGLVILLGVTADEIVKRIAARQQSS